MRIISQNKERDLPYEHCAIWTKIPENIIYAAPIGEPDTLLQMARYTTAEKAEKAMQKLHECYTGVLLMQNVSLPEEGAEQLKNMTTGFICINNREDNVKIEPMHTVFCFPQEDEI